jgi:SurA N-terminal domain.
VAVAEQLSSASLESGDAAVVGDTHITQKQLDQLVTFQVNSAKGAKQKIPAAGTAAYKTQVVDPILQRMITNAQVENIAKELGVTVSDSEVNAGLQKAIQAQFGTDTAKYQAYLKKYAITEDYLKQQLIRPQLLQTKIIAKLKSQYKVTDAQAQAYYNAHKSQYVTADTRKVHYILTKDQGRCECRA